MNCKSFTADQLSPALGQNSRHGNAVVPLAVQVADGFMAGALENRSPRSRYWRPSASGSVSPGPISKARPAGFSRRISWRGPVLLAIVFLLTLAATAPACPTCKDAVAAGGGGANLARGFGWSVIFMLSVPILIFTGIGGYFYLLILKTRAVTELSPASHASAIHLQGLVAGKSEHREH